jgi:cyclic pyranopterin phosphate synthase
MPADGIDFAPREALLSYDEILYLCGLLAEEGITKVRLTGGEPLVRRELPTLVHGLGKLFPTLAMTTNGVLLPRYLDELAAAGLTRYNLSLDTLRPDRFHQITRRQDYAAVRTALDRLLARGYPVKINVVVMRGVNDDEIPDFVRLTHDQPVTVRFIEAMPFNDDDGNHDVFMSYREIRRTVRKQFPELREVGPAGSAVRFALPDHQGGVDIIPAYTRSLCGSCDRLRLTPRGTLLSCLYATRGLDLLPLLREGIGREELRDLIREFVYHKHATGHDAQRSEQRGTIFASMTSIGG